jgi:hypothetical protein
MFLLGNSQSQGGKRRWNERRILGIFNWALHEECMHCMEFRTLERLSQYVCLHLFHGTVLEIKFVRIVVMTKEDFLP